MDAPEIEKLKALALAATQGKWLNYRGAIEAEASGFSITEVRAHFPENEAVQAANAEFIAASCPATVLALIAEVERLRSELAAGAARQGGNTSGNPGPETGVKTAETRMVSGSDGGPQVAAPASGAEKDALAKAAIQAAEEWAAAEHENAKSVGRGGPGCEKCCVKAEAAVRRSIEVLAAIAHTKARDA